MVAEFVVPNDS